jgi:hypothetical protein
MVATRSANGEPAAGKGRKLSAESNRRRPRWKHTPEAREKIAASKRGRKCPPETREKISKALTGRPGRTGWKHKPEARAKISAALRARPRRTGWHHPPETREKISEALTGRTLSPEHVANCAAGHRGLKHKPEAKAKISAAKMGHTVEPDQRAKQSATMTGRRQIPGHLFDRFQAFLDQDRATRPGPATSPGLATLPRIRLGDPGEPSFIDGRRVRALDEYETRVIDELLKAGDDGLSFEEMNGRCGGGWRRAFSRLEGYRDWGRLLVRAGKSWGRYKIMAVRDRTK